MSEELKPCPFCGGKVDLEMSISDGRKWYGVICRNAENIGGTCAIQQRASVKKEVAIGRWNRRVSCGKDAAPRITRDQSAILYALANFGELHVEQRVALRAALTALGEKA